MMVTESPPLGAESVNTPMPDVRLAAVDPL